MNIERQEIRTGVLVFSTLILFVGVLIYLAAPGVFIQQKTFRVFFDDAAGMKPGAQVLLAGRQVGQVRKLFSPVPEKDRPTPKMEALVEIRVDADALIYQKVKVAMTQPKLLGEMVIDFTNGEEASGLASDGQYFLGERSGGIADAVPAVLEKLEPVLKSATSTLESLQKTSENLTRITEKQGDLSIAFSEFREFGKNLNDLTGSEGVLRKSLLNVEQLTGPEGKLTKSLENLENMTGPESSLAKTMDNAERFTASLVNNRDIEVTLRNFRQASTKINSTVDTLSTQFTHLGANLEAGSDTLKRQPWRLIWPTTKKYPAEELSPVLEAPRQRATPPPKKRR